MQISDEQVEQACAAYWAFDHKWPDDLTNHDVIRGHMRRALEAALSLPVQPVACGGDIAREFFADFQAEAFNLHTTPPVPPTGPEDDLIAALNSAKSALIDAQEELRLIRMKDTGAVYDTVLRSLTLPSAIRQADEALALRSRPASALPVVGEVHNIAHDGFVGTVQGHYVTREGKRGVVLQQEGTRVVHVYGEKWLAQSTPSVQP